MKMLRSLIDVDEIVQIIISVLAISLAFTIVFAGHEGLLRYPKESLVFVLLSLVTIGSGFVLHEMSHKLTAVYYGAYAKFKMWTNGIIFMLVVSFMHILFAAPGAVYIYSSRISRRENGIISIAGPMLNVVLAAFFLVLNIFHPVNLYFSFLYGLHLPGIVESGAIDVWMFGAFINLILALFNMIPAFPLDGSKVLVWSRTAWLCATFGILVLGLLFGLFEFTFIILWGVIFLIAMVFSRIIFG